MVYFILKKSDFHFSKDLSLNQFQSEVEELYYSNLSNMISDVSNNQKQEFYSSLQ